MEEDAGENGEKTREPIRCNDKEEVSADARGQPPLSSTPPVDLTLYMEADDHIFFDDTFPSLPDFSCLSSHSASSSAAAESKASLTASSSSSSSSPSPWDFLMVPAAADNMQPSARNDAIFPAAVSESIDPSQVVEEEDSFDLLGGIDLLTDSWDPASIFLDAGAAAAIGQQQTAEERGLRGDESRENPSEDLAMVFLNWLKKNRDLISPEDLRSIKLKRSTIECAASRFGAGKEGRLQLLKLILVWIQNHHLQKCQSRNRARGRRNSAAVNDHVVDVEFKHYDGAAANSWTRYILDPSLPAMMPVNGGDQVAATPCRYYPSGSFSSVRVNSQPFSPISALEFHGAEPVAAATASILSPHMQRTAAPQVHAGFAGGQPMDSLGFAEVYGITSTTKEARKNRMARHRGSSSLKHQRSRQNQQSLSSAARSVPSMQRESSNSPDPSSRVLGGGGSSSGAPSLVHKSRTEGFWSSSQQSALPSVAPMAISSTPLLSAPPTIQGREFQADRRQVNSFWCCLFVD
ncbi:Regulatory protein viviparous-1 [Apostasia shenzhenica]|uniref:Regulatory protein viviparous-1 n=1 Tax=Apostasia shenzhenica TaxID=1088818 RepID=A0A2I0AGG0_9ASPA|nr:Regulatory protein viviparous-1 [Apostasia shenzhenica]